MNQSWFMIVFALISGDDPLNTVWPWFHFYIYTAQSKISGEIP